MTRQWKSPVKLSQVQLSRLRATFHSYTLLFYLLAYARRNDATVEIHLYRNYSARIKCTQLKFSNYKYHFSQKLKRVDLDCLFYLFILKYDKNTMYPSFFTIATIMEYCMSLKHFLTESHNDCKRTWTETRTMFFCFHIRRVPPTCYGRTLCTRCSWSNKTKFTVP